jgi:hypothetical protein
MYSFAQHPHVAVIDEPLYGHYLRASKAQHPGRDEVINAMNCDGNAVISELLQRQAESPLPRLFMKHMAHHLLALDLSFLAQTSNIFLIRDPQEMLPSLTVQLPHAGLSDTGLRQQWLLFSKLTQDGMHPVVLDSRELLLDPRSVLRQLCKALDLRFFEDMLSWPAGPRPEDGVWAPHWYHTVHQSTGFAPYTTKSDFPPQLKPLLDECRPWYERLYAHALRADDDGDSG